MLFSGLSTLDVLMLALHVLPHCSDSNCSIINFLSFFFFQFGTKTRQIKIYLHLKICSTDRLAMLLELSEER